MAFMRFLLSRTRFCGLTPEQNTGKAVAERASSSAYLSHEVLTPGTLALEEVNRYV